MKKIKDHITKKYIFEFRYWFIEHFMKGYLKKSLARRQGACKQCGVCCGNCKHLEKRGNKKICKIHPALTGSKTDPRKCHTEAPYDEWGKNISNPDCGYYWVG